MYHLTPIISSTNRPYTFLNTLDNLCMHLLLSKLKYWVCKQLQYTLVFPIYLKLPNWNTIIMLLNKTEKLAVLFKVREFSFMEFCWAESRQGSGLILTRALRSRNCSRTSSASTTHCGLRWAPSCSRAPRSHPCKISVSYDPPIAFPNYCSRVK